MYRLYRTKAHQCIKPICRRFGISDKFFVLASDAVQTVVMEIVPLVKKGRDSTWLNQEKLGCKEKWMTYITQLLNQTQLLKKLNYITYITIKKWLVWFNDLVWRENQCPNFVIVSCRFSKPFGICTAWGKNRQPAVVAIADEVRKNMIWTLWIHGCDLVDFFWRRCIQTVEQCWTLV